VVEAWLALGTNIKPAYLLALRHTEGRTPEQLLAVLANVRMQNPDDDDPYDDLLRLGIDPKALYFREQVEAVAS
jgi:hypothetical protein